MFLRAELNGCEIWITGTYEKHKILAIRQMLTRGIGRVTNQEVMRRIEAYKGNSE